MHLIAEKNGATCIYSTTECALALVATRKQLFAEAPSLQCMPFFSLGTLLAMILPAAICTISSEWLWEGDERRAFLGVPYIGAMPSPLWNWMNAMREIFASSLPRECVCWAEQPSKWGRACCWISTHNCTISPLAVKNLKEILLSARPLFSLLYFSCLYFTCSVSFGAFPCRLLFGLQRNIGSDQLVEHRVLQT